MVSYNYMSELCVCVYVYSFYFSSDTSGIFRNPPKPHPLGISIYMTQSNENGLL